MIYLQANREFGVTRAEDRVGTQIRSFDKQLSGLLWRKHTSGIMASPLNASTGLRLTFVLPLLLTEIVQAVGVVLTHLLVTRWWFIIGDNDEIVLKFTIGNHGLGFIGKGMGRLSSL